MYMRLVEIEVKDGQDPALRDHYAHRIIPALERRAGCFYAGLLQSVRRSEHCISLTIWDSRQHFEDYEEEGVFRELLDEARPYLADSSWNETRMRMVGLPDLPPAQAEPMIRSFPVAAQSTDDAHARIGTLRCLRIVSVTALPGKLEEFIHLYKEMVIPTLRRVTGCRHTWLLMNDTQSRQLYSISSWDSAHSAGKYEQSGLFEGMLERARLTLRSLPNLTRDPGNALPHGQHESEAVIAERFQVLAGKEFG